MTTNQRNAVFGIADYAAQPVAMLIAAPLLVRGLGSEQFGLWILVTSVGGTAAGLSGGFGEATTRYVSKYRGTGDAHRLRGCLTACLLINFVLGSVMAVLLASVAPLLAGYAFRVPPGLQAETITALRLGALIVLLRAVEAVLVASVRAFERYPPVVVLGVSSRIVTLAIAVGLARRGLGIAPIVAATALISGLTLLAEGVVAQHSAGGSLFSARALRSHLAEVAGFGGWAWLKSATGVVFSYADRLAVASLLGPAALALYALANQITQPIPALLAAGTNFLFPHLSTRWAARDHEGVRRSYRRATLAACACAACMALPLLLESKSIVTLWLGPQFAAQLAPLVVLMAAGNALLALTVVPHYAALALGRARSIAFINVAAAIGSLVIGVALMTRAGIAGAGGMKIAAGAVSLLMFSAVRSAFADEKRPAASAPAVTEACGLAND